MNHAYRVLWNDCLAAWVAVPETAKTAGKGARATCKPLVALLATIGATTVLAAAPQPNQLPVGGSIVAGSASISQSGSRMDIAQSSQRAILQWQRFDIGANAQVNFNQPAATSVALNRVVAGEASQIQGRLTANGQVWLVNPNGVIFGAGSRVDVGGLVASSLDITIDDFLAGRAVFNRNGAAGKVENHGEIRAADGGLIALLAPEAVNAGLIAARLGNVVLAAGERVTLEAGAGGHLHVAVDPATVSALVDNRHLVQADGGQVVMSAQAADALHSAVVANSGTVQAQTLENRSGRIYLLAAMTHGEVRQDGLLDASAPVVGDGGFVETSAAKVGAGETAHVTTLAANGKTGTWLIDPNDYTIAATGGDITGTQLGTNLGSSNIVIQSADGATAGNGDIFVNDAVTWSANKLTLSAIRNIQINANLNGSGTAQLALEYGQGAVAAGNTADYTVNAKVNLPAGNNFSTKLGSDGATDTYTVITSLGAAGSTTATDLQGMNGNLVGKYALGADIDASATSGWNGVEGWMPVGTNGSPFTGRFAGLGHTIAGLTINRPTMSYVGMFGRAAGVVIRDVGLLNANIKGFSAVGALVGMLEGKVASSYATGSVYGDGDQNGGLVGRLESGNIDQSYATADVGGGGWSVGGLLGILMSGTISNSYATGNVSGYENVGGLVGEDFGGAGVIANSYASGSVTGAASWIGGLLGRSSTASVVNNSYWDTQTTGQATSAGGTGKTTAEMKQQATFSGWDFTNTWRIYEGASYPVLRAFQRDLTVTADNASKTYDGLAYSGGNGATYSVGGAVVAGALSYGGTSQGATNAGSYAIAPSHALTQQDYQNWHVSYANGTLTVDPRAITVTASDQSRAYGAANPTAGATTVTTGSLVGTDALGTATITAAGTATATANAGTTHALTPSVQTFGTGSAANYTITYANGTLTITAAPLTVTANAASKTYDGNAYSGGNGVGYSGFVNGETSAVLGGALAYGGNSQGATNAGSYTITPSGLTSSNYTVSFANGTLTIAPAVVIVALGVGADNKSKTYGSADPVLTYTISSGALAGGDSFSGSLARDAGENVGNYAIRQGSLSAGSNYTISFSNGVLTIAPAPLTVTAANADKTYDGLAYAGGNGVTYSGFVNGETSAVLGGTLAWGGNAQGATNAGSYSITPSGLTSGNYTIGYQNGTLTIAPAPLTVTANDASKAYDGQAYSGGNGVGYSGFVNGETNAVLGGALAWGGNAQGATNAGSYSIAPSGLTSGNYTIGYQSGTLTIAPVPLTVTANDASKAYDGQAYSGGNGVGYAGFVNGETSAVLGGSLAWGGTSQGASAVGNYSISPSGLTSGNYMIGFLDGLLTIALAPTMLDGGTVVRSVPLDAVPPAPTFVGSTLATAPGFNANAPVPLFGGLLVMQGDFIRLPGE